MHTTSLRVGLRWPLMAAAMLVAAAPWCGARTTLAFPADSHAASATQTDELQPKPVDDRGTITKVTLYTERAAVTRTVRRTFDQGVWAVRIGGLPATMNRDSLYAKIVGADSGARPPKLLAVEYSESSLAAFAGTTEGVAMATRLKDLRLQYAALEQQRTLLDERLTLVNMIGVRPQATTGDGAATQPLNLESARKQMQFLATERAEIRTRQRELHVQMVALGGQVHALEGELEARGGADRTERTAVVVVAVPARCELEIEATYMVSQAGWMPAYNLRAAGDRTGVEIEYEAKIAQSTGEDWNDVKLSLSTAQPTRATAPPPMVPWYLDIVQPMVKGMESVGSPPAPSAGLPPGRPMGDPGEPPARRDSKADALERLAAAASVQQAGVAVAFDLPRTLDVPSNADTVQRTRIATVTPATEFTHVAEPIATDKVFLRGRLTNGSSFQLLPGEGQVFMGGTFVGATEVPSVAPGNRFDVYFGADASMRARRELVSRTTSSSGFFGGSDTVVWNYRVTLDNGTGRDVKVQLLDRRPVSANEKIVCTVSNLSRPLSTDKEYTEGPKLQGILRWDLTVPAAARGDKAEAITWTVDVTRPKNLTITPLP
jgi:uncharacterized protein (TIGR02231 family)